jgi:CBS domain-containing protein
MLVQKIMTKRVVCCTADDSAQSVARLMSLRNVGAIPVIADERSRRLIGIVTDRDLCCRVLALGKSPNSVRIRDVMTRRPFTVTPEATLAKCEKLMQKNRVRRIPVVDENGRCVGIVAQADLARWAKTAELAKTVAVISQPARGKKIFRLAA